MTRDDIRSRFLAELPRVVGAMFETSASKRNTASRDEDGFVVTIEGTGGARGELRVYFDRKGAETLARAGTGSAPLPPDAAVVEHLKELCTQIIGALCPSPPVVAFHVSSSSVAPQIPAATEGAVVEVVIKGVEHTLRVTLEGDLEVAGEQAAHTGGPSRTLDVIMDIDLPLVVRFGRTELPLKTLTTLGPGSVIDLGRAPDDPVEILISNRVVARGEVVIVAGSYGVRVRDVVSPAERARSLEAELS